jgi:integrase
MKVVSERLGHASVAFTMDVYAHVTDDMQNAAAEAADGVLERVLRGSG